MPEPLEPRHTDFAEAVHASFHRQGVLEAWGARIEDVQPGRVRLTLPYGPKVTQQQGFFHGGVVATLGDSAGGYAAMTLLDAGQEIVSVEYKVNFLAPAVGELLEATGHCVKPGRRVLVSTVDVDVVRQGDRHRCAVLLQTLMPVEPIENRS
ncbi:MAG: PaaI family thioesterase [Pseudomonadota bacterium]